MLKSILKLNGVQKLSTPQKRTINGGTMGKGPTCQVGPFILDCSGNTDGRCTCVNGRCVKGPSSDCR